MGSPEIPNACSFTLKNLNLSEASRVVGHATDDPTLKIECIVKKHPTSQLVVLFETFPYFYAENDNQERLAQLTTAMAQGGGEFDAITTITRANSSVLQSSATS